MGVGKTAVREDQEPKPASNEEVAGVFSWIRERRTPTGPYLRESRLQVNKRKC